MLHTDADAVERREQRVALIQLLHTMTERERQTLLHLLPDERPPSRRRTAASAAPHQTPPRVRG